VSEDLSPPGVLAHDLWRMCPHKCTRARLRARVLRCSASHGSCASSIAAQARQASEGPEAVRRSEVSIGDRSSCSPHSGTNSVPEEREREREKVRVVLAALPFSAQIHIYTNTHNDSSLSSHTATECWPLCVQNSGVAKTSSPAAAPAHDQRRGVEGAGTGGKTLRSCSTAGRGRLPLAACLGAQQCAKGVQAGGWRGPKGSSGSTGQARADRLVFIWRHSMRALAGAGGGFQSQLFTGSFLELSRSHPPPAVYSRLRVIMRRVRDGGGRNAARRSYCH
jgi:hypothetical protein